MQVDKVCPRTGNDCQEGQQNNGLSSMHPASASLESLFLFLYLAEDNETENLLLKQVA
jgi:hypothetical protein